jgi:hypothetical protein
VKKPIGVTNSRSNNVLHDQKQTGARPSVQEVSQLRHSPTIPERQRLPNRRAAETFELDVGGLRYTATIGRFADGSIGELFLSNGRSNSAADTNARDAAIAFSFAVQHGADFEAIRRALSRDSLGRASGPLGAALDRLSAAEEPYS